MTPKTSTLTLIPTLLVLLCAPAMADHHDKEMGMTKRDVFMVISGHSHEHLGQLIA